MFTRLRTTWFAGTGAMVLVLALSGAVLGASVLAATSGPTPEAELDPLEVDTTLTFEDLNGNGIDDDCETDVVADEDAAAAADAAVDADGDGTVSVSEAAQSDRTGGKNCNHGGYVSQVAQASCDAEDEAAEEPTTEDEDATEDGEEGEGEAIEAVAEPEDATEDATCAETEETETEDAEDAVAEECVEVAAPPFDPATMTGPGAFGAYVSSVAQSDAVGGKNCNHGGAVSEAVKAAKELARAEREAARELARAEREAAKAERKAEREAAKAERAANRAAAGKGKAKGH